MPKQQVQAERKIRLIQGTKIPIACHSNCSFKEVTVNVKSKTEFSSTPISSKESGQPICFRKLPFTFVEPPTRKFSSNININFQFTKSINSGFVDESVASMEPYVFSGSDQLRISPIEKKKSNNPLARPSLTKLSPGVHVYKGSNVKSTKPLTDLRLERHQKMFKSRYAIKNHCDKAYVGGIRLNRRFDLLMKHREDHLDRIRVACKKF